MKELRDYKKQDEYYTPRYLVEAIIPYLKNKGIQKILCPFDNEDSEFVLVLTKNNFEVDYSIDGVFHENTTGIYNFFDYSNEQLKSYDLIISNPPFSKKKEVMAKLIKAEANYMMLFGNQVLGVQNFMETFTQSRGGGQE